MIEKHDTPEGNALKNGRKQRQPSKKAEKKERLAEQLRENLLRRKQKEKTGGDGSFSGKI